MMRLTIIRLTISSTQSRYSIRINCHWLNWLWQQRFLSLRFLNHSASLAAEASAMNSADTVESTITVCLLEAHEMTPPP